MEFIAATQPGHWGDENALPPRKLLFAELCAARDARKITTLGQFCAPSGKKGVLNINNFQLSSEKLQFWYNGIGFPKNLRYFNFK
jgi:hypothetical protein